MFLARIPTAPTQALIYTHRPKCRSLPTVLSGRAAEGLCVARAPLSPLGLAGSWVSRDEESRAVERSVGVDPKASSWSPWKDSECPLS